MNTFELLEELSKKSKDEIEYVLKELMLKEKIDFINVSNSYVECMKILKNDTMCRLIEAESCVMEGFIDKPVKERKDTPSGRRNYNHTQRCLYLLNQSNRFLMGNMNKEYNYNEKDGKEMSVYERNKELRW